MGFPSDSVIKNPPVNTGDASLIPGSRRSPEEGNGNPRDFLFFQAESQSSLKPNALSVFCKKLSPFHKTLIPKGEWEGERAIP